MPLIFNFTPINESANEAFGYNCGHCIKWGMESCKLTYMQAENHYLILLVLSLVSLAIGYFMIKMRISLASRLIENGYPQCNENWIERTGFYFIEFGLLLIIFFAVLIILVNRGFL